MLYLLFSLLDVEVERNAYGPQIHSKFQVIRLEDASKTSLSSMCFIRAPKITHIGEGIDVLARCEDNRPCAIRKNNMMALSFHPEVSGNVYFHKLLFFDR
jgi:5'-phosphate synthase pdxT subunit